MTSAEYGTHRWEDAWVTFESEGNVGLTHVTNPVLYTQLCAELSARQSAHLLDIGCGTHQLAIEFLYAPQQLIPALRALRTLETARTHVAHITGIEGSHELVLQAQKNIDTHHCSDTISVIEHHISTQSPLPLNEHTVDIALSRHLLMHFSVETLRAHLQDVYRVLVSGGVYICAILNPEYEQWKSEQNQGRRLRENEQYQFSFSVNAAGQKQYFTQWFRGVESLEHIFREQFTIQNKEACYPLSDEFRSTHPRYYMKHIPTALVYTLTKKPV